jgi:hypothetical protein
MDTGIQCIGARNVAPSRHAGASQYGQFETTGTSLPAVEPTRRPFARFPWNFPGLDWRARGLRLPRLDDEPDRPQVPAVGHPLSGRFLRRGVPGGTASPDSDRPRNDQLRDYAGGQSGHACSTMSRSFPGSSCRTF